MNRQGTEVRGETFPSWTAPTSIFVLLEVVVACIVVVGLFGAAARPFGWASVAQLIVSVSLGVVLWVADSRLAVADPLASADNNAHRPAARRESLLSCR